MLANSVPDPGQGRDALTVSLTAKQLTPRLSAGYGDVRGDAVLTNQDGSPVATTLCSAEETVIR